MSQAPFLSYLQSCSFNLQLLHSFLLPLSPLPHKAMESLGSALLLWGSHLWLLPCRPTFICMAKCSSLEIRLLLIDCLEY